MIKIITSLAIFCFAAAPHAQTDSPDMGTYEYGGTDRVAGCALPPTAGLIGWWKLDEKSGTTVHDSSGNGYNGTRVDNPTYQSGKIGDALHFNNTFLTNVHVRMDNVLKVKDAMRSGYVTFSCWAYPDRVPDQDPTNTGEGLVFTGYLGLSWNMSQRFFMGYFKGETADKWAKSSVHSPGRWYHVAGVVDTSKGTNKIYVNGKHEGTATFPAGETYDGGNTLMLGIGNPNYPSGQYGKFREAYKGKIDDVRIYNRTLSDAEIADLYFYKVASDSNLLLNPSFEDGRRDWNFLEPGEVVDGSAHALAGSKCLKITVNGKSKYRVYQAPQGVKPGETLQFRCWMKSNSLNGEATVILKFWIDRAKDQFKYFTPGWVKGTMDWREYSITVVAPDNFKGDLQIVCFAQNCKSGEAYFDDLRFERVEGQR